VSHASPDELAKLMASLSDEQQMAVEAFIQYLRGMQSSTQTDVQTAVDEFIHEHSELLRRLAQ